MINQIAKIFSRYPTYLIIGSCVTLLTIILRSFVGLLIRDDSTAKYLSSIILVYIFGIYLSFVTHKFVTFKNQNTLSIFQVLKFIGVHIVGMIITLICSIKLRELYFDALLPLELSKMSSFAGSAFLVSVITYLLKKFFVF